MDIQQFLAEGPLGALLCLAIIPIVSALMLIGYLVFAVSRRNRKNEMKLGLQTTGQQQPSAVEKAQKAGPSPGDSNELDTALLAAVDDSTPVQEFEPEPVDISSRLAATAPAPPSPQPKADPVSAPVGPPGLDEPVELLRLLRQPQSGQLVVEIAGQQFTRLADIKDRKLGQYVLRLVAQLLAFTGGAILTESGVKSMPPPPAAPLPAPPFAPVRRQATPAPAIDSPDRVSAPPPEVEAEFLASLSQATTPPPPKRGGLLGFNTKPASIPPAGELLQLNLADEINNVVQKNLARSPLAETNRVEILSNLGGGLRILVNQQAYTAPEDIPDEAVKKLIKDSIKEWERS